MANQVITLIISLVVLVTALLGLLKAYSKLAGQVQEIHILVNSNLTAAQHRVEQLTATLTEAGIAVPPAHTILVITPPSLPAKGPSQ